MFTFVLSRHRLLFCTNGISCKQPLRNGSHGKIHRYFLNKISNFIFLSFLLDPENYEGDIILNENQTALLNSRFTFGLSRADGWNKHWPKNVPIAYEFSDEFNRSKSK